LPRTLFQEIGKIVVVWATIEQDLVLHASAMASQKTDGFTTDYLRFDFKRLREKWYSLCREYCDEKTFNKVVHPINTDLATYSELRGNVVHTMWHHAGRGKYTTVSFEQKGQLIKYEGDVTLHELRSLTHHSFELSQRIHAFVTGNNGSANTKRAFLEPRTPVIPSNQD
jgi:hypothetical protein